jgi:hypothetical protein
MEIGRVSSIAFWGIGGFRDTKIVSMMEEPVPLM